MLDDSNAAKGPSCPSGFEDCDGDGDCETETNSDRNNCGACAKPCAPWLECGAGECVRPETVVSVAAGRSFSCAAKAQGNVLCWGANEQGQLGDGTTVARVTPAEVAGLHDAVEIIASGDTACARRRDGTVVCWGDNQYGQLASLGGKSSSTPVAIPGVARVRALAPLTAIVADGSVVQWGHRACGSSVSEVRPVTVAGAEGAVRVTSEGTSCVVLRSGGVRCWGNAEEGSLGDGKPRQHTCSWETLPRDVVGVAGAQDVSFAGFAGCAVQADRRAFCWGTNQGLKFGTELPFRTSAPVESGAKDLVLVRLGLAHACGIDTESRVRCWGDNLYGALGRDFGTGRGTAALPVDGLPVVRRLAVGAQHACTVTRANEVFCWGRNDSGQLGASPGTPFRSRPERVSGL